MYESLSYINNEIKKLKSKKHDLLKDMSSYDKEMSNYYHQLELIDINAPDSQKFMKEFQDMLRSRRKAKFDYHSTDKLIQYFHNIKQKLTDFEENYFKDNDNYKEYIYQTN